MSNSNSRIPDHMAGEVLAEATRLHAQISSGYSLEDLQQAGLEARIPPELIQQAVKNVEERHSLKRAKRQQSQQYIRQQIQKGISGGVKLLIPTIFVSGLFIGRSYIEPILSKFIPRSSEQKQLKQVPKSTLATMAVKEGKLEYFGEPKGLSIAVNQALGGYIQSTIGTDGYDSLEIKEGKVGDVYNYKGIYNYRLKIIEVSDYPDRKVTFQIDQQGQPQTQIQRLEEKNKQLQEQPAQLQKQLEQVQIEKDSIKRQLEEKERNIQTDREFNQQQLQQKDKQLEELRKENIRLKAPTNSNKTNQTPVSNTKKPQLQLSSNSQQLINYPKNINSFIQEPELMLPEDFRKAIMNKTMDEVAKLFGKPALVSDLGIIVFWRYDGKVKDPNNSYITIARVRFENGIVGNVELN